MRLLDHGVEQAGEGIVTVAVVVSSVLVVAAVIGYLLWRRYEARRLEDK